jgi:uncharacterized membrane protein
VSRLAQRGLTIALQRTRGFRVSWQLNTLGPAPLSAGVRRDTMRIVALLCLLLGFMGLGLLDGQTFTHAVMGLVFGAASVASGMASARRDPPHRWKGWIMAGLGVVLGLWCAVQLPSGYRFQKEFNGRREQRRQEMTPANQRSAVDAGFAFWVDAGRSWSGATDSEC